VSVRNKRPTIRSGDTETLIAVLDRMCNLNLDRPTGRMKHNITSNQVTHPNPTTVRRNHRSLHIQALALLPADQHQRLTCRKTAILTERAQALQNLLLPVIQIQATQGCEGDSIITNGRMKQRNMRVAGKDRNLRNINTAG